MIELPADLAEVLKTVQSNANGADITFPNGDEELLADLAAAWHKWNQVADSHVVAIVEAAQRAMASMSGPAADSFHQYLQKFAGGEGSHVATTLQSGHIIATSLQGASQTVSDAKNEMIRELQYAKEYMEDHPAGKHDDIAQSEGVKQAAAVYHRYIGQVGGHVDTRLRQSADHIADMTGMGQTCILKGTTAGGSSGTGGTGGAGGAGGAGSGVGVVSYQAGATLPGGSFAPGTDGSFPGGAFAGSGAPSAFSLPGTDGSGVGGAGALDGAAAFGGAGGYTGGDGSGGSGGGSDPTPFTMPTPNMPSFGDGSGGSGGGSDPTPFTMPTPNMPSFGDGSGGSGGGSGLTPFTMPTPTMTSFGSGSGSDGGGMPVFTPLSTGSGGSLSLAGLGDLGDLGGLGGTATTGYTPSSSLGLGLGTGGGTGGLGGNALGNIGSALGSTLGSFGGSGSSTGRAGLTPFGGTGSSPFGLGGASGRGTGAGGSALAGRGGGAGAGSANGISGAGRAGAGTSGTGGATGGSGATGAGAGGHMPGAGGAGRGGGGKEGKHGNRFVSPTRFGGEEDEELYGDPGILGQATDVGSHDRRWHRARRRWLDDARADGTFATSEAEPVVTAAAPASESEVLNQLAGVLLGGGATAVDATGTDGAGTGTSPSGEAAPDLTARQETAATAATETSGGGNDDAYLERARSVAARRGHPDAPEAAPAASAASVASTAGTGAEAAGAAAPQRTPLREEGGYQVPSPFLRAALSRLAAPAAD